MGKVFLAILLSIPLSVIGAGDWSADTKSATRSADTKYADTKRGLPAGTKEIDLFSARGIRVEGGTGSQGNRSDPCLFLPSLALDPGIPCRDDGEGSERLRSQGVVKAENESGLLFEIEESVFLGDTETPDQAKARALENARRRAMEMAGTRLESVTVVSEGQLTKDEIVSRARSLVRIERLKYEIAGREYTAIVTARVTILEEPEEPNATVAHEHPDAPLQLIAWVPKTRYGAGEEVNVGLKLNKDADVGMVYHQADGSRIDIFPNRHHPESRLSSKGEITIPSDVMGFKLRVGPPYGRERLVITARSVPLGTNTGSRGTGNRDVVETATATIVLSTGP